MNLKRGPAVFARPWIGIATLGLLLLASAAQAQSLDRSDLNYFRNYFVTGDYAAAGVGLAGKGVNGIAEGTITLTEGTGPGQIPKGADILAAYLYYQIVSDSGGIDQPKLAALLKDARFRGNPIAGQTIVLQPKSGTAPCWSSGGATGSANGSKATYTFRSDVLRYLPKRTELPLRVLAAGTSADGTTITHSIALPDSGGTGATPNALYAGLVIVWRQSGIIDGKPRQPLRSIVIFDGGSSLNNGKTSFKLPMPGFYQASGNDGSGKFVAGRNAYLTQFAGAGSSKFGERIRFSGTGDVSTPGSYDEWLNVLGSDDGFNLLQREVTVPANASSAGFYIDGGTQGSSDCLNWGMVALSMEVTDTDGDGLLDAWETNTGLGAGALKDPAGNPLPPLARMGANPNVPDLFVEINYAKYDPPAAPPAGAPPQHSHLPSRLALNNVALLFRNAASRSWPRRCDSTVPGDCAINVHFDVGNLYQCGDRNGDGACDGAPRGGTAPALPSLASCAAAATWTPDCAIIPYADASGRLARGGWAFQEFPSKAFPAYYGVIGWKSGFRSLKEELLLRSDPTQYCTDPKTQDCVPRFERGRKDIFRYALFGHWVGIPSVSKPGAPRSTSGIADSGGADLLVTLGAWDSGNLPFLESSTLAHELGHTLGLKHGGVTQRSLVGVNGGEPAPEPNCKPNYQSVMSYLFQVRGLRNAKGVPVIDFSRKSLKPLDENALPETIDPLGSPDYLPSWYTTGGTAVDKTVQTNAVQRRCDGSLGTGDTPRFRVDVDPRNWTPTNAIDWNLDGLGSPPKVDANYDAAATPLGAGSNDFETMDFRQIGARRAVGSPSIGGGLSLDTGYSDVGYSDVGYSDVGYSDVGYSDVGYSDVGYSDVGYSDVGYGDNGYGDAGFPVYADASATLSNPPAGDVDLEHGGTMGQTPSGLTATINKRSVILNWFPPIVGRPTKYTVYRVVGSTITEANLATAVQMVVPGPNPPTSLTDTNVLFKGAVFTYFVIASVDVSDPENPGATKNITSGASNYVTVTY